jgi:Cell division control protein 24, OB domain 1
MVTSPIFQILSPSPSTVHKDPFLGFVEYARSTIASTSDEGGEEHIDTANGRDQPPWCWTFSRILKTCVAYPSGVTAAILLSDLFQVSISEKYTYLMNTIFGEVME